MNIYTELRHMCFSFWWKYGRAKKKKNVSQY